MAESPTIAVDWEEFTISNNQLRLESGEGTGEQKSPEFEILMSGDNRTIRFEFSLDLPRCHPGRALCYCNGPS